MNTKDELRTGPWATYPCVCNNCGVMFYTPGQVMSTLCRVTETGMMHHDFSFSIRSSNV